MTIELAMLFWACMLGLFHIALASFTLKRQTGHAWTIGARDDERKPEGMAGRMQRAHRNFLETFPLFAALVLMGHMLHSASQWSEIGAQLYFWGRVAYIPAYAYGRPGLRSMIWQVATLGLVFCAIPMANRTLIDVLIN